MIRPVMSSGAKKKSVKPVVGLGTVASSKTGEQLSKLDAARRRLIADWCRLVGRRINGDAGATDAARRDAANSNPLEGIKLSPRARQVLTCLLNGDSEKQIALRLQISPHTVHTYVKKLHQTLGVNSRGELLARFVAKG